MAIETQLAELTTAVAALTEVTKSLLAVRQDALQTVKEEAPKTTTKKAETTKAAEPAKEEKSDATADATNPAYDELGSVIKGFVGMDDNKDRRAERSAIVKKLFAHDKIKAKVHTDVPEAMIKTVIANIEKQKAALTTKYAEEDAAATGSDDGDDLMG